MTWMYLSPCSLVIWTCHVYFNALHMICQNSPRIVWPRSRWLSCLENGTLRRYWRGRLHQNLEVIRFSCVGHDHSLLFWNQIICWIIWAISLLGRMLVPVSPSSLVLLCAEWKLFLQQMSSWAMWARHYGLTGEPTLISALGQLEFILACYQCESLSSLPLRRTTTFVSFQIRKFHTPQ